MRRLCALALFVAAVPVASAFVPGLRADAVACAMACHASGTGGGAICCMLGSPDRPVLESCAGSRDGVPPAPGCRIFAPRASASLAPPRAAAAQFAFEIARPISRSVEPPDPVPLRLF